MNTLRIPELEQLISEVKQDPLIRHLWETGADLEESRDGHVYYVRVPALNWETIEVVSHVLYPASAPGYRFTVLTWIASAHADDKTNSLGGQRKRMGRREASRDDSPAHLTVSRAPDTSVLRTSPST